MYDFQQSPLRALLTNATHHKLPKGQILQFSDNRMFVNLVVSGYIKRYLLTDDGQESIQVMYGRNDIFPLTPVFKELLGLEIYKGDEVLYYQAHTDVEIYSLGKTEFINAILSNELMYKDLFYVAGTRLGSNIQKLENTSLRTSSRKVIDLILYYAQKFGTTTDEGVIISMPLTHQTIANILNITRETVSINMTHLQDTELIFTRPSHTLLVKDIDALRRAR